MSSSGLSGSAEIETSRSCDEIHSGVLRHLPSHLIRSNSARISSFFDMFASPLEPFNGTALLSNGYWLLAYSQSAFARRAVERSPMSCRQDLECHVPVELRVPRPIHFAHPAFADLGGDVIRAVGGAWL